MATTAAETEGLWKVRRSIGEAVKSHSIYKEQDTVVPRFYLPELLAYVKELGAEFGFESVCYGHAGDGNLHVNILRGKLSEQAWEQELPIAIRKLFKKVKELGGTLSGEHGIGWVQKNYMDLVCSPAQLEMMRGIKSVFDPKNILNPGKIFPDAK
jgi:glycolate oxidase